MEAEQCLAPIRKVCAFCHILFDFTCSEKRFFLSEFISSGIEIRTSKVGRMTLISYPIHHCINSWISINEISLTKYFPMTTWHLRFNMT